METNNNQSTFDQMWATRPPRIPKDQGGNAVGAGVCEGIAVRYQIDVTLVRLAFVALSLVFGSGLFIYVLCWLCMPRFGMSTSPAQAIGLPKQQLDDMERKERDLAWLLIILLIVFFPSISIGTAGFGVFSSLGGVALAGLAWWALHQRLPEPPAGLIAQPRPRNGERTDTSSPADPLVTAGFSPAPGYPHPGAGRTTPPAWDPLGTAPALWHLPDPDETLGAGAGSNTQPQKSRRLWLWIPVALVCSGFIFLGLLFTDSARFYTFDSGVIGRIGDTTITYHEGDDLERVNSWVGSVTLDLSDIGTQEKAQKLEVGNYIGSINITLPKDVPVDVTCASSIGENNCPAGTMNKDAKGETITIDARQFLGEITIE
ncbi:PspC domain-containing protein [Corynebacterium aquatimens]|uniref:Phage shock protein PspC (Stress-responsive transcriptional regulator) n=1 Tax=Corynebacterium aquatimens TaxID=1190508 RepID=A0A931DZ40_9CORY|nr:PspC domain-containing protein [Corynebacterium aquatimens]MBG6123077.1 phage shock protein PspC (stress-responsive transcriptional regulator) [Corynebacterium aquatimens]WJY66589.1 PspC domain protein [Corynebacterium aquatimens]